MLELKNYQKEALDVLRQYFESLETLKAGTAFYDLTKRPYTEVDQLSDPPYVCLRVPTGGGKTLMACHSIAVAAQTLLRQERAVVLWLVPTNTIKDQTLSALKDRSHPYRQALDATLDARVRAVTVDEALHIQRPVLDGETVVIVSTLATPRIGDTDKRKLYEQNGDLMAHFSGYSKDALAGLETYEGTDDPIPSLANVLFLRKPIVIMDEAHNARTALSFETLARFDPSCIIEFTATPATDPPNPSNVLHSVTAYELKTEEMIKLPIRLDLHEDWHQTILSARNKRDELQVLADEEEKKTGRHLRPIVLLQAQKKNEELTVDVVRQYLLDDLEIPKEQVIVETGEQSELGDTDLFSRDCPVRYIITVDKLREGWDCSFAYVLCSVRDIGSATAVEQILGRVLRMPEAKKKQHDDLNKAYAFVTSAQTADIARATEPLIAALENRGFSEWEARQSLQTKLPMGPGVLGPIFRLPDAPKSPAENGEKFSVPELSLWEDEDLEPVEKSHFLQYGWQIGDRDAALSELEYSGSAATTVGVEITVNERRKVESHFVRQLQEHLGLLAHSEITSPEQLVVWIDSHLPHPDITQPDSLLFIDRVVKHLMEERKISLPELERDRLRLRDAIEKKIDGYRKDAAAKGYEQVLFGVESKAVEVNPIRVFTYVPDVYPANPPYQGNIRFNKHYYPLVGDMDKEEAQMAQYLDSLGTVKYWVRNIERQPKLSFWLPTSTDKFYPDFMAMLGDERVAAVEYKGGHIADTGDTEEKTRLGKLWEAKSKGKCLFFMVTKDDFVDQLRTLGS